MIPIPPPVILLVDDVPENLRLLSAMLKEGAHQVRHATSGKRALESASQSPPDLILLDIRMPEMDGWEVCRQLKADARLQHIPIIFISALNEVEDKIKALDAGGVDYITKPFQEREVHARVKTHLELSRQKAQLAANYQQLQQLEKLRDSLIHMIVHDMRTPLMVIDSHLSILELTDGTTLSSLGRTSIQRARESTSRLVRMAADMLTVSKLEAGEVRLELVPVDLVTLARKTLTEMETIRGTRTLRLATDLYALAVPADAELIARVLQNLLGNALKYSPDTGQITVAIAADAHYARVEVTDQGRGIAPEDHAKIFEKFGQVGPLKAHVGTGLGLTFCQMIIAAHGGTIGVKSQLGAGSTFWFTLPMNLGSGTGVSPVCLESHGRDARATTDAPVQGFKAQTFDRRNLPRNGS